MGILDFVPVLNVSMVFLKCQQGLLGFIPCVRFLGVNM